MATDYKKLSLKDIHLTIIDIEKYIYKSFSDSNVDIEIILRMQQDRIDMFLELLSSCNLQELITYHKDITDDILLCKQYIEEAYKEDDDYKINRLLVFLEIREKDLTIVDQQIDTKKPKRIKRITTQKKDTKDE